jgi:hypothetical protein
MTAKKTATTRTTPSKPKKTKQPAAPPRKETATVPAPVERPPVGQVPAEQPPEPAAVEPTPTPESARAEPKRTRKPQQPQGESQHQPLSALDAAAKVLAETGQAMNCRQLIAAMAAKGYWASPTGQTPSATLYSGILREMQAKGDHARFVKTARGQFALRGRG